MDLGLAGKWALVCGASKGLGLGCAQALAAEGAHVVMVARRADVLEASAAALRAASPGVQVIAVAADITTEAGRAAALGVAANDGVPAKWSPCDECTTRPACARMAACIEEPRHG